MPSYEPKEAILYKMVKVNLHCLKVVTMPTDLKSLQQCIKVFNNTQQFPHFYSLYRDKKWSRILMNLKLLQKIIWMNEHW